MTSADPCSSRVEWAKDLLGRLGDPLTTANETAVVGWELKESSLVGGAAFNPINSTRGDDASKAVPPKGASPFNTIHLKGGGVIHVWNYASCEQGLDYTVATLNNGSYNDIKAALAASADPAVLGHAKSLKVWGTGSVPPSIMATAQGLVG